MLTANALDEHMRASHEAGADLHLSKPIHAQALIESIMNAISAEPQMATAVDDEPAKTDVA
jgi:CheY-like chemotaxis protein